MSPDPRQSTKAEALNFHRAFCDLLHDAGEAEIDELIRTLGENPEEWEKRGTAAVEAALLAAKSKVIPISDHLKNHSTHSDPSPIQRGFSHFMQFLRRKKEMEIAEVAMRAQVDVDELVRIEDEPGYLPSPRAIFQLERFFELPADTLSHLSGAVTAGSDAIQSELLKFAACSDGLGKLTKDEKRLLNEFVHHLAAC